MAKGRQQYFADEVSIQKEAREFAIEEQLKAKIDSVEEWAQVNVIETVKVNWEALIPDEEKAVDVDVPVVEDNLYSVDTEAALSARQWKVLYDYIQNLQSRGRYLSNWNSATWLPTTNPSESPYLYRAWDYFLVSNVSTGTNYRPDWSQYEIWVASETVETDTVMVSDMYIYDWNVWQLIKNGERPIVIDDRMDIASTNPVENRVITQALRTKQDTILDLQTIREWAALWATSLQPWDSITELTWTSDDITEGTSHLFMTPQERAKLWNQSWVNTWDETQATIMAKLWAASATTNWYLTTADWNTFNDKQDAISDLQTIRDNATAWKNASDTIATYGDIVTHNINEFATAAQWAKADTALQSGDNVSELVNDAWYITDAYHDDTKQDVLTAWENITIEQVCWPDNQWPCPEWRHIPFKSEWETIISHMSTLWIGTRDVSGTYKLSLAWWLADSTGNRASTWYYWAYWCADGNNDSTRPMGYSFYFRNLHNAIYSRFPSNAQTIRPFKDTPVTPDNTWTILFDWSSVAAWAWVFHNATEWLISSSADWINWITMADKNLWATDTREYGTRQSDEHYTQQYCGNLYQRWNNYAFSFDDAVPEIDKTSDKINVSEYWPGHYYSSRVFRTWNPNDHQWWRSLDDNFNLWWWNSRWDWCVSAISATDTTYQAGDFDIKDLADSTGKRAEWDAKQDALDLWANLSWWQDWKLNATDTTYTAGPGISISQNNVISNTRTSAEWWNITWTLSDQTDLQNALDEKQNSFNVVDTLPDVSQADMNATYYLSVWNGKYEEWIVVEEEEPGLITFTGDVDTQGMYYSPNEITFSEPTTLTFINKVWDWRIEFVAYDICDEITGECVPQDTEWKNVIYADAWECSLPDWHWWRVDNQEWWLKSNAVCFYEWSDQEYVDASSYTFPAWIKYSVEVYGSYMNPYDEVTFSKWSSIVKKWKKVWDQWWSITWNLSDQTDLQAALDLKADLTDVRTKIFEINNTAQVSAFKPAIDWIAAWNNSIIKYINTEDGSYNYFNFVSKRPYPRSSTNEVGYYFASATPDVMECYVDDIISGMYVLVEDDWTVYSVWIDRVNIDSLERDIEELNRSVLKKNNTQTYTPTWDYNPATKKYVDDAVAWITPGQTYTAWNNIDITNNVISAKNVIKTDTTNTAGFTIEDSSAGYVSQIMPGGAYMYVNSWNQWADIAIWPGQVMVGSDYSGDDIWAWFISDDIYLFNRTDMTSTSMKMNLLGYRDNLNDIDEQYELSWWWNNQIARLKDVPVVSATQPTWTEGMIWYDTINDVLKVYNWTAWKEAWTQMKVLSYGHSTWQDFLDAYNENAIVYCRASSQSNPWSWNQTRMAFMAFVDVNATTWVIQGVEFQYYRSRSDHNSAANQLDEVYVYKLTSNWTWTVTQRNTAAKAVAWTWINLAFGSGNMTISNTWVTSFNWDTWAITLTPWTYLSLNNNVIDVDTSLIATKADLANFAGFLVVAQLPTTDIKTNIIYLLWPVGTWADKYEEYIYSNNNWIMIGDTTIDLSPYFHKTNDDSDDIIEWSTNLFLTSAERTKLWNTSWTNSGDETKTTIQTKLWAASSSNSWYLTSADYDTFNGKADAADVNTKLFRLESNQDLTTAQAAYDWRAAWKNPIITHWNWWMMRTLYSASTTRLEFVAEWYYSNWAVTPNWNISEKGLYVTYINANSSWVVTSITAWEKDYIRYLNTNVNYPTPYIPQYDWSPATKKYVDDAVAWAITNNTTWTTTSITQIWCWTEAEYQALWTYQEGVAYMTF